MNWILIFSVFAWALAQVLKVVVMFIIKRKLDFGYLVSSGGMPSSHSAVVCSCAASIGALQGWSSAIFALAAVTAFVVMYDAANVRKAAGEQAKILNYMMEHWNEMPPEIFGKELKELLGHTPVQVFMGAILGIAVGLWGTHLFC